MVTELTNFQSVAERGRDDVELHSAGGRKAIVEHTRAPIIDDGHYKGNASDSLLRITADSLHSDWSSITDESSASEFGVSSSCPSESYDDECGYECSSDDDTVKVKNSSVLTSSTRSDGIDEEASEEYTFYEAKEQIVDFESEMEV